MSNAPAALQQGFDYQARWFWIQACRLFEAETKVGKVVYEAEEPRAFDDVVVCFTQPVQDERGNGVTREFYQLKFHVDFTGEVTAEALTSPDFIGAKSKSLLQRLHAAQKQFAPDGKGALFTVVMPWSIKRDDALATLVSAVGGQLRLDRLFEGGPRSEMGKVRAIWATHLGLQSDAELRPILAPLQIWSGSGNLRLMKEMLNCRLAAAGLAPVDATSNTYDDLIRKLAAQGRKEFDRDSLTQVCKDEKLWRSEPAMSHGRVLGVRSFMRFAENMQDYTQAMLSLVPFFDGRRIRDTRLWTEAVVPQLRDFLAQETSTRETSYQLYLDAHSSIAFAAGYILDAKAGVDLSIVQRTLTGTQSWRATAPSADGPLFKYTTDDAAKQENDVALAVSVTARIDEDVRLYVQKNLPSVGRLIFAEISPAPSSTAVKDANHALALVQSLADIIKQRSANERGAVLHLFIAAPNALTFMLGQHAKRFGTCVIYEYDFDTSAPGAYSHSIQFPNP